MCSTQHTAIPFQIDECLSRVTMYLRQSYYWVKVGKIIIALTWRLGHNFAEVILEYKSFQRMFCYVLGKCFTGEKTIFGHPQKLFSNENAKCYQL